MAPSRRTNRANDCRRQSRLGGRQSQPRIATEVGGGAGLPGGAPWGYHDAMPREVMDVRQVARYLNLPVQEVVKLAARGKMPARKVSGQFRFRKGEIDHWVETQMPELSHERMAEIEQGVSSHHGMDHEAPLLMPLIPAAGVVVPLPARTREAAIRALVAAADGADLVYEAKDLVEHIRQREGLCPTALLPGVALPHPRHPLPNDIAASFVIVGRTAGGIPFGCPDGSLTRLLFLICCKDERTHLHVLARISRMLDAATVEALMDAPDAEAVRERLGRREADVLADAGA